MIVLVSWQGSPLFELLKQEHEGGAAEQVETPASYSQPLQHNHTAADLWVHPKPHKLSFCLSVAGMQKLRDLKPLKPSLAVVKPCES